MPRISWSELADRRVGLWGLGVEGLANLRRLRSLGVDPVLVDDAPDSGPVLEHSVLATANGGLEALFGCEVVVKSPGISRHRTEVTRLEAEGVTVAGGLGLWIEEVDRNRVVCITGTKGKSTTASVLGHLLGGLGHRCLVGGNIGRLPYDPEVGEDWDFWVIEVSSFQAMDLLSAPPVVAVTSLSPDHLDWHGDVETYYSDKLSLCSRPGARVTVAAAETPELRAHESALAPEVRWVSLGDQDLEGLPVSNGENWTEALGLVGPHLHRDALIARACLSELRIGGFGGAEAIGADADIRLALSAHGFIRLDHRLQNLGTLSGVTFIDDGLSTNVLSTLAALDAMPGWRVALLVGGFDRGIDYAPLAAGIATRTPACAVFSMPSNGARIGALISETSRGTVSVTDCDDLATATTAAFEWARPDGVVLLSPAAPSFGEFRNYADRSAAFAGAMQQCAAKVT